MTRTQIQLPDPLYREIKRIAVQQDWSIAEVIRRGAENVVRHYPPEKLPYNAEEGFRFPAPIRARLRVSDPEQLKDLLRSDQEQKL
jgi:hypothetical protein